MLRNILDPYKQEEEPSENIRPKTLKEYIGQDRVKEQLGIYLHAARQRGDALDHVLFYGPPGLGKTTLAQIIAYELGIHIEITSGPALEHPGDIAAILTNLKKRDSLFIDEIHRLNRVVEEKLYPAMEDFRLDLVMGQGPAARLIPLPLEPFTLIGATTRFGSITSPMRDRFGIILRLEFYTIDDLVRIVTRAAALLTIPILPDGALEIARRSRGTPRIANRLLKRIRDFAQIKGDGKITREIADMALNIMEIDHEGLDPMDRRLLTIMAKNYGGGPVGIDTLATALMEDRNTIEDVFEPYMIQKGFIRRTPRGRLLSEKAYDYLGLPKPSSLAIPELPFDMEIGT